MKYTTEQIEEMCQVIGGRPCEVIRQLLTQRSELLEALKLLHRNFRSQHGHLLILGAPDFVHMDEVAEKAITDTEATK